MYVEGTSTGWNNFDTVASYHGLGKMTVVKKFKCGKKLSLCEELDSSIDDVIKEATLPISDCNGFQQESMTKYRIMSCYTKTSRARKTTPPIQYLLPTDESYK